MTARTALLAPVLLASLAACSAPERETESAPTAVTQGLPPFDVRDDLLRTFRERSSPEEWSRFERLRAAPDVDSRDDALEMLLLSMTDRELFAAGITQVEEGERIDWSVAWSRDGGAGWDAVADTLNALGIPHGASMNRGYCGWYVERSDFIRARRALVRVPGLADLDVRVVDPAIWTR